MRTFVKMYPFTVNNKIGLKDKDGGVLLNPIFLDIEEVNINGNQLMGVKLPDGKFGYICEDINYPTVAILIQTSNGGLKRFELTKDGYLTAGLRPTKSKFWIFESIEESKLGIMFPDQSICIEPIFDTAITTNEFAAWLDKKKIDFCSDPGRSDITEEYIFIYSIKDFLENKVYVFDDYTAYPDVFLCFDNSLKKVVVPNFDNKFNVYNENKWFLQNGYFGLISSRGEILVNPKYDLVLVDSEMQKLNISLVRKDTKFAVLDNCGNELIPFTSDEIKKSIDCTFLQWKENELYMTWNIIRKSNGELKAQSRIDRNYIQNHQDKRHNRY